mmetsp:Transcript_31185/g.79501  ORF Transcript_31185/g.79501 Transcript_31185/m.79501 type:complete len:303 (+) Transcript_31185:441-1349(+)
MLVICPRPKRRMPHCPYLQTPLLQRAPPLHLLPAQHTCPFWPHARQKLDLQVVPRPHMLPLQQGVSAAPHFLHKPFLQVIWRSDVLVHAAVVSDSAQHFWSRPPQELPYTGGRGAGAAAQKPSEPHVLPGRHLASLQHIWPSAPHSTQLGAGAAVASHTRAEEPHLLSWQQAWPSWPHATHVLLVLAQVRVKEGLPDSHLVSLQQGAPSMPQSTQVPAEHMRVSSLHALPPDLQQAWSLAPQAGGATGHFALLHFWPSAHWVLPWQQAWPGAPHATHCLFLQMNPDAPQSEVFLQLCRSSRA